MSSPLAAEDREGGQPERVTRRLGFLDACNEDGVRFPAGEPRFPGLPLFVPATLAAQASVVPSNGGFRRVSQANAFLMQPERFRTAHQRLTRGCYLFQMRCMA